MVNDFSPRPEKYRGYLKTIVDSRILRQVLAKADTSDVVQETMLRAHTAADKFRGTTDGEYRAWLRLILGNVCLGVLRHFRVDKRDLRLERSLQQTLHSSSCQIEEFLEAVQSSPSEKVLRANTIEHLLRGVGQLPEHQQTAIRLHHLQGMDLASVAKEMGRTKHSVAGLLRRGLETLRTQLHQG